MRLGQHALARIDKNDGEIGGRGAGRHVAGVLLVAGRIGDDERALRGGEEAIGDIDGDALLALGLEPIDQQREIDILAYRAMFPRVAFERGELIVENELLVVEQTADQRRFAIVDGAAGDKTQRRQIAAPPRLRGVPKLRFRLRLRPPPSKIAFALFFSIEPASS